MRHISRNVFLGMAALVLVAGIACSQGKEPAGPVPDTSSGPVDQEQARLRFEKEKPIDVESVPPSPVKPGEAAELVFEFHPHARIKVPVYPPAYLENLDIYGAIEAPKGRIQVREFTAEEEDAGRLAYYGEELPALRVKVRVPQGLEPGAYPYRGEVHYFYCYEAGGVCAKESSPVEGILDVVAASGEGKP